MTLIILICSLWTCRSIHFAKEFSKVAGKDIMNHHKEQVKLKVELEGSSFDLLGSGSVGPWFAF